MGMEFTPEQKEAVFALLDKWCRVQEDAGKKPASCFTQLAADFAHSALLTRMLDGKEPLPQPPPVSYSYPWYILMERTGTHRAEVHFREDGSAEVNQNPNWTVEQELDGGGYILSLAPYRIKVAKIEDDDSLGGWLIELLSGGAPDGS
jgi:hypothetical protein